MSRSHRKPYFTDGYGSSSKKLSKRKANRIVRAKKEVSNGKQYRKHSNPWDICDFKFYSPKTPKASRK